MKDQVFNSLYKGRIDEMQEKPPNYFVSFMKF